MLHTTREHLLPSEKHAECSLIPSGTPPPAYLDPHHAKKAQTVVGMEECGWQRVNEPVADNIGAAGGGMSKK